MTSSTTDLSAGLCVRHEPEDIRFIQQLFYGVTKEAQAAAKVICNTPCPVRMACLEQALRNREPHGVWGGLTAKDRAIILRARTTP